MNANFSIADKYFGKRSRPYRLSAVLLLLFAMLPNMSWAQQNETTANCDEGVIGEPVALVYGNSTFGCAIEPATDSDRFFFSGSSGELIQFCRHSKLVIRHFCRYSVISPHKDAFH